MSMRVFPHAHPAPHPPGRGSASDASVRMDASVRTIEIQAGGSLIVLDFFTSEC